MTQKVSQLYIIHPTLSFLSGYFWLKFPEIESSKIFRYFRNSSSCERPAEDDYKKEALNGWMQRLKIKVERYVDCNQHWSPDTEERMFQRFIWHVVYFKWFSFPSFMSRTVCTWNIFTSRRVHVILSPMRVIRELKNDVIQLAFFNISERTVY